MYKWSMRNSRGRVVTRLAACRDAMRFRWLAWDKGNALFCCVLLVPVVVFGAFGRFAYVSHAQMAAARQREADLRCLAENVYHEARGEPLAGQYAVAEVTLNRVAAGQFPGTVCAVVHEQRWDSIRRRYVGAFSWTELARLPRPRGEDWETAMSVATAVYDGRKAPRVAGALFYHATSVKPSWAVTKTQVARIGRHVFYE